MPLQHRGPGERRASKKVHNPLSGRKISRKISLSACSPDASAGGRRRAVRRTPSVSRAVHANKPSRASACTPAEHRSPLRLGLCSFAALCTLLSP
jgi:hypothetical protein